MITALGTKSEVENRKIQLPTEAAAKETKGKPVFVNHTGDNRFAADEGPRPASPAMQWLEISAVSYDQTITGTSYSRTHTDRLAASCRPFGQFTEKRELVVDVSPCKRQKATVYLSQDGAERLDRASNLGRLVACLSPSESSGTALLARQAIEPTMRRLKNMAWCTFTGGVFGVGTGSLTALALASLGLAAAPWVGLGVGAIVFMRVAHATAVLNS
jgi:hypothetical protein